MTSVGGWVVAHEEAKITLPQLTSVGGLVEAYEGAKIKLGVNCKIKDEDCPAFSTREFCLKFNFECFLRAGFLFADNILANIIEKKKNVYKIQIAGSRKISYCIEANGVFAHGDTIKQAKEDLKYKFKNRDLSAYEGYTLDTVVTFEEALQMYHDITGACSAGTKHFVETKLTVKKKKYTVKECIELTKDQYGHDTFKEFFIK